MEVFFIFLCFTFLFIAKRTFDLIETWLEKRPEKKTGMDDAKHQAVCARLDKMEQRLANVETIVLEAEKHKEFERALS